MTSFRDRIRLATRQEKDRLLTRVVLAVGLVVLSALPLLHDTGSRTYYRANNALFLINALVVILFIVSKNVNRALLKCFLGFFDGKRILSLNEIGDGLVFLSYMVTLLSTLFILDVSFISNYGVRIGGVMGVIIFRVLRNAFSR